MKTLKLHLISLLMVLLAVSSCITDYVDGNGNLSEESRYTADFSRIHSAGSFDVYVSKGVEFDILVRAEENILPYIETWVSNDVLHIETKNFASIRNELPMEVFITTPELRGVKLSGSGLVETDYFSSPKMDLILSGSGKIRTACDADLVDLKISGSGKIELSGSTERADINISGSGNVEAANLSSEKCYSSISGSGNMWVTVDDYLRAHISGSGNVYYYGSPELDKNISGSGKVLQKN